jgi:hypothetical protein
MSFSSSLKKNSLSICPQVNRFRAKFVLLITSLFQDFACYLHHDDFLLGLPFDPEDGSDIFLRNVR